MLVNGAAAETGDETHQWLGRSSVKGRTQWIRMVLVTCNLLGMQLVWSTEMGMAAPYLLSLGVSKSALAGILLAGPISGLLVQPIVGAMSDNCKLSLGRRRPFILGGCAICAFALFVFGWARQVASLFSAEGGPVVRRRAKLTAHAIHDAQHHTLSIWLAALSVWVIDFSVNAVQAADRALLVDVLPASEQAEVNAWAGRLTGIGAIAGFGIANINLPRHLGFLGSTQMQVLAVVISLLFVASHLVTCWAVTERVLLSTGPDASSFNPRKIFGELWHSFRTLPDPIWLVYRIQLWLWVGWFGIMFYSTTWVSEMFLNGRSLDSVDSGTVDAAERAGSQAMLIHSVLNFTTTVFAPMVINHDSRAHEKRRNSMSSLSTPVSPIDRLKDSLRPVFDKLGSFLPDLPIEWLTLSHAWFWANGLFSLLLFATFFVYNAAGASTIIALTGICWAFTAWVPFTLLGEMILQTGKTRINGSSLSTDDITAAQSFTLVASEGESDDEADDPKEALRTGDPTQVLELHHADSLDEPDEARPPIEEDIEPGPRPAEAAVVADSAGTIIGLHNIFVVIPQLVVSFLSTFIFAGLSPHDTVPPVSAPEQLLRRQEVVASKWDSIGLILRLGGVAAAYATWLSWRMVRNQRDLKVRRPPR